MRFRGAVLVDVARPLEVWTLEQSQFRTGQVLVKIELAGICGSQLFEVDGDRGVDRFLPHTLGHEAVGRVMAVADDVTKVAVGDRVFCSWIKGAGIEAGGGCYSSANGPVNHGPVTTLSEYAVVSENRLYKAPAEVVDPILLALLGCALPTGGGMVLTSDVQASSTVLVLGLGGIGLAALIALVNSNVTEITCIEPNKYKRSIAAALGCRAYKNYNELLDSGLGVNQYDFCFESTGTCLGIESGFKAVKFGNGACIFASHPPAGEVIHLDPHALISGKKLVGTWGGGGSLDDSLSDLLTLFNPLPSCLRDFIPVYPLDDINMAFSRAREGNAYRVMVAP